MSAVRTSLLRLLPELLGALVAGLPVLMALDRGRLLIPAVALCLFDLALLRVEAPRALAFRFLFLGPALMVLLGLGGYGGEASVLGIAWGALAVLRLPAPQLAGPLLAGGLLLGMIPSTELHARPRSIRVGTFNMQWASQGPAALAETIDTLQADVVALQEVIDNFNEDPFDLLGYLERRTNLEGVAYLRWHFMHGGFGPGVLSRYPVKGFETRNLPYVANSSAVRTAIKVHLDVDGLPVTVVSVHLDRPPFASIEQNTAQVRDLLAWVRKEPNLILCGDFNALPVFPGYSLLRSELSDARDAQFWPGGSWPSPWGVLRLDWVFTRGLQPLHQRVVRRGPSDHYPVVVDLALPGKR